MAIHFNERNKTFYISGKDFSYIFRVKDGRLQHLFFGKRIKEQDVSYIADGRKTEFAPTVFDGAESLDVLTQEYPVYGRGDYREPAVLITAADGGRMTDFIYRSHAILKNKPEISGMPTLRGGETLVIELQNELYGLILSLYYTVYENCGAVVRRAVLKNGGKNSVFINKINSFSVDFPRWDLDKICLQGGWAKERGVERSALTHGIFEVSSTRGSSSHHLNPFIALCNKNADENVGEAYGVNLVYSGSFSIKAQVDQLGITRVGGGINEKDFCWGLKVGESFETPEAVLVYSAEGLGKMSRNFHDLYREHLINPAYKYKKRPVVLNCWESFYFDFNDKALSELIEKAKGTGIDTFVLDDGWFVGRNSDKAGLGDWHVDYGKLSGGLKAVADDCRAAGMKFGIWIEPEMVSEDSDLYRAHPDWVVRHPDLTPCKGRHQLVLDFANPAVVDYVKGVISDLLKENNISYVKWDMNRNITEFYSIYLKERSKEFAHRYILGTYALAEHLTTSFPDVFFEGCSGGGGRFDAAMLYYFPQIWTSDNTDALSRAFIQYGTSFCYPLSAMSGHVSACPNHQTARITPFSSRTALASFCSTGFELNLNALNEEEMSGIKKHVKFYDGVSELILKGDLYRLLSPFDGDYFSQMVVSKDKKKALFVLMKKLARCNDVYPVIKLKGLDENLTYEAGGKLYGGDALMNVGLKFPNDLKDFETVLMVFTAQETEK